MMRGRLWNVALMVTAMWGMGIACACAQEDLPGNESETAEENPEEKKKEKPLGWLRLLAVGDAPPFRQAVRDGVRIELPAAPGALPPYRIEIPIEGRKTEARRLQLGVTTRPIVAKAGYVSLRGILDGGGSKPWMRIKMPEHSAALAVFIRDPRKGTWDEARSIVLKDDLKTHPMGAVRLVNASIYKVRMMLGGKQFDLEPGRSEVMRGPQGGILENVPFRVLIGDRQGRWRPVYDVALTQIRGERTNIVVYRADGERPRRPAKVLVLKEKAYVPKLPGKKKKEED